MTSIHRTYRTPGYPVKPSGFHGKEGVIGSSPMEGSQCGCGIRGLHDSLPASRTNSGRTPRRAATSSRAVRIASAAGRRPPPSSSSGPRPSAWPASPPNDRAGRDVGHRPSLPEQQGPAGPTQAVRAQIARQPSGPGRGFVRPPPPVAPVVIDPFSAMRTREDQALVRPTRCEAPLPEFLRRRLHEKDLAVG